MIIDLYKDRSLIIFMKKRILLVEPDFPYPNRSKNCANEIHKNFAPIGLLKLGAMHKSLGNEVRLIRGNINFKEFIPDEILITSIFTYWSKYVWDSINHYRVLFPHAKIWVGGIYATLHKETPEFKKNAKRFRVLVHSGIHTEAEKFLPDYTLLKSPVNHHITHAMRGCIRKCAFCGTWRIEPKLKCKTADQIIDELIKADKNKVIFFDNNFLANPHIKEILRKLAVLKVNNRPVLFESQSGFDGRLLEKDPELADLLKKARFKEIRIAWDNSLSDEHSIKKQIDHLVNAGYPAKEIYIFMIYNFNRSYEAMLKKLKCCKKWGVQIVDCRYRPLTITEDNYNSKKFKDGQTNKDYYIHEISGWTDSKIRDFRKRVRQHNAEIRYGNGKKYDKRMEKWSAIHHTYKFFNLGAPPFIKKIERSPLLLKRVGMLSKLKNYYLKKEMQPPNLSQHSKKELDTFLKKQIIKKNPK